MKRANVLRMAGVPYTDGYRVERHEAGGRTGKPLR